MTKKQSPEYTLFIFDNVKKNVNRKYRNLEETINRRTKALKLHPYEVSEPLKHDLAGLRSVRIKRNFLLIIALCEECRRKGYQTYNNCDICHELPEKSIVIFEVAPHDDAYAIAKKLRARKKMTS